MQAALPYYVSVLVLAAIFFFVNIFKDDEPRFGGGIVAASFCTIALLIAVGECLWHHTFYAGYVFGACFGISLGANLAQTGMR